MKRLTFSSAALALVAIVAGACSADIPSAAAPADPSLAKGGPSAAAYTVLNIHALLQATQSEAQGVNDAGEVVGFYFSPSPTGSTVYPFALVSGAPVTLGGGPGAAYGISNGSPAYVAGSSNSLPARWSLADPTQPTLLPLAAGETFGTADAVNDAGDAVGRVGPSAAAMWLADGTRIPIATPAGFARGEGRGIDNAGLAVFQYLTSLGGSGDRGYVRLASGTLIELPPVGADVSSYVNDIAEVTGGLVYVSGSTSSSSSESSARAVRWTVDAASGAIIASSVVTTTGSHGLGVSQAGGIAGFSENRSLLSDAFLWRGPNVLKLAPPKGIRDARAWAISRSGQYVAGHARTGGGALRWTIATP
jgi:hypothetical protein